MYQMTVSLRHLPFSLHSDVLTTATFSKGMYPTIIIVLVTIQKSHLESQFTYPEIPQESSNTGRLSFASRSLPHHGSAGRVTTIREMAFAQSLPDNSSRSLTDSTEKTEGIQTPGKAALGV